MLTVYTSTFCRPDYVQLLAWCLRQTLAEPYRFVVVVHPSGLRREWDAVDAVVAGTTAGYQAWSDIIPMVDGPSVIIHDDCVPVLAWDSTIFPRPHCIRAGGHTLQYHAGPFRHPHPAIRATRITNASACGHWSECLCSSAVNASAESMLDGTFVHIDKGTIANPQSPANEAKPNLVQAIAEFVGTDVPQPLTAEELAAHPGRTWSKPGLGDMVKTGLSAIGITEERVSKAIGRPCGCGKRAETLNELGRRIGIG